MPYDNAADPFLSTPQRFFATAALSPNSPAYFIRGETNWEPSSWAKFADEVRRAARGLIALGVQPGDRVSILGYNRPEWVIADLAAMSVGAIPVGIYFSSAPSEIAFVLSDSQSVVLFAENPAQHAKLAGQGNRLGALKHVVMMCGDAPHDTIGWSDFLQAGATALDAQVEARIAAIKPSHAGTWLYTSGTTGNPKAVELSHAALSHCLAIMRHAVPYDRSDRLLSYLPLAHIAEKMLSVHVLAAYGPQIYFARSVPELAQHLPEVRPTVFFGVPRVWEKLSGAIRAKLGAATGAKAQIAAWAQHIGIAWHAANRAGTPPGALLTFQYRLAHRLVFAPAKAAIGLDQARILMSGAAPIAPEILEFLSGLDLVVLELYGQSETCGPTTSNLPGANKLGSVGRPMHGTELKIAPDGEILVHDAKLFTGYAGRPDATAETLINGWLHSGDLGHLDDDGYLYITGRKKDLIITAGGKNISPAPIESAAEAIPLIEHLVIYGDRKPYLTAIITLNPDALATFLTTHNLPPGTPHTHPAIQTELQHHIDTLNAENARVAAIRKFTTLPTRFTVESGELTPTLKIKRATITARHQATFNSMYESQTA
jgi:long-chain acyl-CoA synthetase